MKIIFMGNPAIACPILKSLQTSVHKVVAVVSNAPKAMGRGQTLKNTAVGEMTKLLKLPFIPAESLKDEVFIDQLKALNPDLIVIVAFRILPNEVLAIPKMGSINLHASLLPKYRGAAPIQQALMNGDQVTGITTFLIEPKVDTGAIIFQEKISILPEDNFGTLSEKMAERGCELVLRSIDELNGDFEPTPQNNDVATTAPKILKEMYIINWSKDAKSIHNKVRGLSGAFTTLNQKRLKVFKTAVLRNNNSGDPGQIILIDKNRLAITCGKGALELIEIQMEGNKMMLASEWMKGAQLSENISFGA